MSSVLFRALSALLITFSFTACSADKGGTPNQVETPRSLDKKTKKGNGTKEESKTTPVTQIPKGAEELVIYSGRSAGLVEPLLKTFEKTTGIKVKTRFDKSTANLANRIATEGTETEADIFFAQDSGYLGALARAGHLEVIAAETLAKVDTTRREAQGRWVATSGRARVLVYSPGRVKATELPNTLAELADPKWSGRLGWAPSNSSYQAHVSALRKLWGEEKTKTWLKGIAALKPTVYPKNSPQVKAVSNGEIDIGWVNHYYLHKLKAANPKLKAANYTFTEIGDAGNLMMLSGVAVLKHSKNKAAAQRFAAFLLSKDAQDYFAQKVYEYPMVAGVATHPNVPAISTLAASVDQEALADVAGTIKILRELGLQ
jgi:iron(III) transport system substrate-binding protein